MARVTHSHTNQRAEMLEFLPAGCSRVLEVGCGQGRFRKNFESQTVARQPEYWGIEPNEDAATAAVEVLDKVLCGTFDDVAEKVPDHYFDLVVCNDVIEHMVDHDDFLIKIKDKMKPSGILVGSVPNVRFLGNLYEVVVKRDWEYKTEGILDRTHLRFFTMKSLSRTFTQLGYDVEILKGINTLIKRPKNFKRLLDLIVLISLSILTFNKSSDLQYMQIGFRVQTKGGKGRG